MVGIDNAPSAGFGIDDAETGGLAEVVGKGPDDLAHREVVLTGGFDDDLTVDEELDGSF